MRHTLENAPHLEKFATINKMRTLGKMRHTEENAAHLEKCATLKKMRHSSENS